MSDEVRPGRPEAAATIWDPRGSFDDRRARAAKARRTAVLRAMVAAIAGAAFFYFDRPVVAYAVFGVATAALAIGLVAPLALDRAVGKLARLVGTVLAWVLLAPFYYLVVTPLGLLTKRGQRDPLRRRRDPEAPTYWKKRKPGGKLDRPY